MASPSGKRRPIMVLGCTSDAGKSFLVAALCRHYANRGLRVAPFKAQNMSNNAAVTATGEEIGRAQYLQAVAARVEPDARMNPILLKPSGDTHSQVIVRGRYDPVATRTPWLERRALLWEQVSRCLDELVREFDVVVIEGAGSPAEVNLRASDLVNMSVAAAAEADAYLVSDIDRGGSFAHLLGTHQALEPQDRRWIKGFVLNRFRGDAALLGNAPEWLEERTGVPTVALVPYERHTLPEEDALRLDAKPVVGEVNIALVVYPWASNLDEFDPLTFTPGVNVVPVFGRRSLASFDLVILPGSKNSGSSLQHLRDTGLDHELMSYARAGRPLLGVCGGLQLLGREIRDPHRLEHGDMRGLGLLDVTTTLAEHKRTRQTETRRLHDGLAVSGYEIHHGETWAGPAATPYLDEGLGWRQGNITGVYLHGLAENTAWRQELVAELGGSGEAVDWQAQVDRELDRVAGLIESSGWASHLDRLARAAQP
jgi:adenosylcobyric acid synthase